MNVCDLQAKCELQEGTGTAQDQGALMLAPLGHQHHLLTPSSAGGLLSSSFMAVQVPPGKLNHLFLQPVYSRGALLAPILPIIPRQQL